jgi:hypothetical protein
MEDDLKILKLEENSEEISSVALLSPACIIFYPNLGILALVNTILNDDISYSSVYFHNSEYTYK